MTHKLAVLNSHPIQYFAPLYRRLAEEPDIDLTVYYCNEKGAAEYEDQGFGQAIKWDVPVLGGYRSVVLKNYGWAPQGFWSLVNPGIIRELRGRRYDAVWIHGYNYATYLLAYATARLIGTSILTRGETHLGLERPRLKLALRKPLLKLGYSQCQACLAIGTRNADFYRAHGVPDHKIFMVPYTVDNSRFIAMAERAAGSKGEIRASLGLPSEQPIVIFASKLTKRKRPQDLLEAKLLLERQGVHCTVIFVGSGEQEPELRSYTSARKLSDVHFAGFKNQTEMPELLAIADIFVLPSENEPWGLVINEAMCAGLPIVASEEIGAAADLIRPGYNGEVFAAGDVNALVHVLGRLLRDPALMAQMGRRSREIIQRWSYEESVAGITAALRATRLNGR